MPGGVAPRDPDVNPEDDPQKLAVFVQEYVRREQQQDAGTHAVIAAQLRDPQWLPHQIAERLLSRAEIKAAVAAARAFYKPLDQREVSVDTISADMEVLYQEAKDARQFTAAIQAKKLQAEVNSLIRRDVQVTVSHRVEDMTTAQLMQIASRASKEIEGEFTEIAPVIP